MDSLRIGDRNWQQTGLPTKILTIALSMPSSVTDRDIDSAQRSNWERWSKEGGPFYRACAVVPFDTASEPTVSPDVTRPEVQFTSGVTRTLLRNLPTFLFVTAILYFSINVARSIVNGEIQLAFPELTLQTTGLLVLGVLIGGLWLYLVYRLVATAIEETSLHRSIVFFGTAIPLAAGTIHAALIAWTGSGNGSEPAITVQTGYFLFVLVTGHLVYDGLTLRTENFFARLRTTSVVKQPEYDEFYEELTETLGDTLTIGAITVPRSVVFALVIALIPILLPVIVTPWAGWGELAYVAYSIVTLFVIAVLYDVFILVYKFTDLLRRDILTYQPFHPDDHGGFRDFGRFATRVNTILLVAGGYVAYRFYAEGVLNLPSGGLSPSLLGITWVVLYLGPIAAYVFLVLFWLYHSFWRLHQKMEEGRQERTEELQRRANTTDQEPNRDFADLETDAPPWESLRDAPTWPIKRQGLFGILFIDAVPVIITFV